MQLTADVVLLHRPAHLPGPFQLGHTAQLRYLCSSAAPACGRL